MKYIVYINQGDGFKKLQKEMNYSEIIDFIKDVYNLDNRCEVIIKYIDNNTDYCLCSFVNTLSSLIETNMKLERRIKNV